MKSWLFLSLAVSFTSILPSAALELAGLTVTPHEQSPNMRYRQPTIPGLGARVEMFLRNNQPGPRVIGHDLKLRFDDLAPSELISKGEWAWHDTPPARVGQFITLGRETLTVWSFNSRTTNWGTGTTHKITAPGLAEGPISLQIDAPKAWLSSVTFLGKAPNSGPGQTIVHVANQTDGPLSLRAVRFWLPMGNAGFRIFHPQPWLTNLAGFPVSRAVPAGEKGGFTVSTPALPLTYGVIEVGITGPGGKAASLWTQLRIKRETFDLGGGWVASELGTSNTLHSELYLKTLRRMHINSGMHQEVPGYTDTPLYEKYPLKYMNRLQPLDRYDTDPVLPRIHAVEFLGEPQYGGGKPVPPHEVWTALRPYESTRLQTSVTHSEERVWRFYAGLSDYPHFDAYRVTAPSPDSWGLYDRWGGERIRWGAPLETIGDMTRSLRELNRPRPIAYWSQGAHDGWGHPGGRMRSSPTADELRAQACHAIASRITSLYWFNLSLKSLLKFPDLIEPITRMNREIRMIEDYLLEGDAYDYRRESFEGRPSWDLASVTGPNGALLFSLDLNYVPDPKEKVFRFTPREGEWRFKLPTYLSKPAEVFRIDADGPHSISFKLEPGAVVIRDRIHVAGIYVVSPVAGARERMKQRHMELLKFEKSFGFDPGNNAADLETLRQLQTSAVTGR